MESNAGTLVAEALADLSAQGPALITAALGVSALFWGAKYLWSKARGMAR